MKKAVFALTVVLLIVTVIIAQAADITPFLKISSFGSSMKTAMTNLESLFMKDQLEFNGDARAIFIEAWKTCQSNQKYPDGGSLTFLNITTARTALEKAVDSLDTLVYDQRVKFKTADAKKLYREALKGMRIAIDCL